MNTCIVVEELSVGAMVVRASLLGTVENSAVICNIELTCHFNVLNTHWSVESQL